MKGKKGIFPSVEDSTAAETSEHARTQAENKSVRKVSAGERKAFAKTDMRYWAQEKRLHSDRRRSPMLFAKIQFQGRRAFFPLNSPNVKVAAPRAAAIYKDIVALGWEKALAAHKPETVKPIQVATIGELLAEVRATAGFKQGTFTTYMQCLRQIAAGIKGIGDQPAVDADGNPLKDKKGKPILASRFDYRAGGRDAWLAKVDSLALDVLSADAVQRWKLAYIAKAGEAPDARRHAETSAASLIRCARALFSEKALRFAKAKLSLPSPIPFAGVKLPKPGATKYQSKISAHELIADAKKELTGAPFQIFTLALLCGLRKREIDLLMWKQVDFAAAQIRIERTEWFEPKSEDSIGTVDVDLELLALLRGWKASSNGPFVIESKRAPRHGASRMNYRCEPDFEIVYAWLRKKGVAANKPLHELRKELGALLASEQGIFAAQSVLRHAQISTTANYYTDKKRTITAGLGKLLVTPPKGKVTKGDFTVETLVSHKLKEGSKAEVQRKPAVKVNSRARASFKSQ